MLEQYEQQIDNLIDSGDVNNWRLALELCKGLTDEEIASIFIGKKCYDFIFTDWNYIVNCTSERFNFMNNECNVTWRNGHNSIKYEPRRS